MLKNADTNWDEFLCTSCTCVQVVVSPSFYFLPINPATFGVAGVNVPNFLNHMMQLRWATTTASVFLFNNTSIIYTVHLPQIHMQPPKDKLSPITNPPSPSTSPVSHSWVPGAQEPKCLSDLQQPLKEVTSPLSHFTHPSPTSPQSLSDPPNKNKVTF